MGLKAEIPGKDETMTDEWEEETGFDPPDRSGRQARHLCLREGVPPVVGYNGPSLHLWTSERTYEEQKMGLINT